MSGAAPSSLLSPSDIAELARVSRGAVSNWRKRAEDFPQPVAGSSAKPLFDQRDVERWLLKTGKRVQDDRGETVVWAALNALRGHVSLGEMGEALMSFACAQRLSAEGGVSAEEWRDSVLTTRHSVAQEVQNLAANTGDPRWVDLVTFPRNLDDVPQAAALVVDAVAQVPSDVLAAACDAALQRLATAQIKSGGDYGFVGSRTSTLLATLAASTTGGVLYDPACGVGAALIAAVKDGSAATRLIGHDVNRAALRTARQRAYLHGIEIELRLTDVLVEDADPTLEADVVIAEPPIGLRWNNSGALMDPRFVFGVPTGQAADLAWVQHAIAHLSPTGRAYIVTARGPLFRSGQEQRIRAELIRRGCVEAIVGLPGKMLPQTSVPLALWVLRTGPNAGVPPTILFLDASDQSHPERLIASWLKSFDPEDGVPRSTVPTADVLAAEALLAPERWITHQEPASTDIADVYQGSVQSILDRSNKISQIPTMLNEVLEMVRVSDSRVITVGELVDQGILELRVGRSADYYDEHADRYPEELRDRLATAADVRDGTLNEVGVDGYEHLPDVTREGDVLVTTMNTVRARVDDAGGHLPSTGVHRLRVLDDDVLSRFYLALVLTGSWNSRFQGGSTIQRAPIRDLEIPLIPKGDQTTMTLAMHVVDFIHDESKALLAQATSLGTTILDAVRYNVRLVVPEAAESTRTNNKEKR